MKPSLKVWTAGEITVREALSQVAPFFTPAGASGEVVALLYTGRKCGVGAVDATGNVTFHRADTVDLDDVYQARVFGPEGELRWRDDPGTARGQAVFLTRSKVNPPEKGWRFVEGNALEPFDEAAFEIPGSYLLWGNATGKQEGGWSELFESRIGSLWVPTPLQEGERCLLSTVEFTQVDTQGQADGQGNAFVAEEILTGIQSMRGQNG